MITLFKYIFLLLLISFYAEKVLAQEYMNTNRFGKIEYYKTEEKPSLVVFYLKDEKASDKFLFDQKELKKRNIFLAKIDANAYLKEVNKDEQNCFYLAGEFERLSQVVQKNAKLNEMSKPLLVGDGKGAALVYVILAQAVKSFLGGISFNFCPELPLKKELCPGANIKLGELVDNKDVHFGADNFLTSQWYFNFPKNFCHNKKYIVFQNKFSKYFQTDKNAFSCSKKGCNLLDNFVALSRQQEVKPEELPLGSIEGLPLIELDSENPKKDYFVVLISGDGGWATIDKELGKYFHAKSIKVVGFDALKYFWTKKDANTFAKDIENTILTYQKKWGIKKVIFAGYSLGADVLTFATSRLSESVKNNILANVLLNPSLRVEFEVHFTDWLDVDTPEDEEEIMPEVLKLVGQRIVCLYGSDEKDTSLCPKLAELKADDRMVTKELEGSHHFGGDYEFLGETILGLVASLAPKNTQ